MNSLLAPDDFYSLSGKAPVRLTQVNAARLQGIDLPAVSRERLVEGLFPQLLMTLINW